MNILKKLYILLFALIIFDSCIDETLNTSVGVDDTYIVERMKKLIISSGINGSSFTWETTSPLGIVTTISETKECIFIAEEAGMYALKLVVAVDGTKVEHTSQIIVKEESIAYSPNISAVYDYMPAPGQFVNVLPQYEEGDTQETMNAKALSSIADGGMVSLGSCGGYIVFGFDHTVVNVDGKRDFAVYGNAVLSKKTDGTITGASAEPGVVYVSIDVNGNGVPDDTWYELAGSEYGKETTIKGYEITYTRPDETKPPVPGKNPITDAEYIIWRDNRGGSGYVEKNSFHEQSYYPKWISFDKLTLSITRLPKNGVDVSGSGTNYILYPYDWGYVDNHPNRDIEKCSFDIEWAVDAAGKKVRLPGVDFIKVSTGVIQMCGWIGEVSTEVSGATDLHL